MKSKSVRVWIVVAGIASLVTQIHVRANLGGQDDFADGAIDPSKWSEDLTWEGNTATFTETDGEMQFISTGTQSAAKAWVLNSGSIAKDWVVSVDVHVGGLTVPQEKHEREFGIGLVVYDTGDAFGPNMDYLDIALINGYWSVNDDEPDGPWMIERYVNSEHRVSGQEIGDSEAATDSVTVRLRITYDASAGRLQSSCDDLGNGVWHVLTTAYIDAPTNGWDMEAGGDMGVMLLGVNDGWSIGAGVAAFDDFLADGDDSVPPNEATQFNSQPQDGSVELTWHNPDDSDLAGVIILQRVDAAPTDSPVDGVSYVVSDTIGNSTVVYAGSDVSTIDAGLTNGRTYFHTIFTYDDWLNYSSGTTASGVPTDDVDLDGMDDAWELACGGDLSPVGDDDQDGVVNIVEFKEGLDPTDQANPDDPAAYDRWLIIRPGWNLVSTPRLTTTQMTAGELLGECKIGPVWQWDADAGHYITADDELVSWWQGYWIFASAYCAITMEDME